MRNLLSVSSLLITGFLTNAGAFGTANWWSTGLIYPNHEMDPNSEMYGFWASPGLKMADGSTLLDGLGSEKYTFEIGMASEWTDSIGHALQYSRLTGRKPGIVLFTDEPNSGQHIADLMAVINQFKLPIAVVLSDRLP